MEQLANSKGQKKISEFCGAKSAFKPYDSKKKQGEAEDQQAKSDEESASEAPEAKIATPSPSLSPPRSSKNKSPGSGHGHDSGQEPPQNSQMGTQPHNANSISSSNSNSKPIQGLKQTALLPSHDQQSPKIAACRRDPGTSQMASDVKTGLACELDSKPKAIAKQVTAGVQGSGDGFKAQQIGGKPPQAKGPENIERLKRVLRGQFEKVAQKESTLTSE